MADDLNKVLVVGPSWIGDMVMAQSLFITIKNLNPDAQIDVLAPAWTFPLLARMPEVNQSVAMPLGHGQLGLGDRVKLGRHLVTESYHRAIVLPNSWKSALVPFAAKIPQRVGYLGECRWGLLTEPRKLVKQDLPMTVQRFVSLGLVDGGCPADIPIPKLHVSPTGQALVTAKFNLTQAQKILALCPGAEYGLAKRWLPAHFAAVAEAKIAEGWQVMLLGSDKDRDVAKQINLLTNHQCLDFIGKTTLAEAVDLLSLVDATVSNDSGLMHVAAALNKPLVAIYGSSDPGFTPPLHQAARIVSLQKSCAPCFKRECPLGHTQCLTEIMPARILAEITAFDL
ncbi:MAG TPA: lipopolysaccharide heptosyltransferase II [Methylococcaceae bacterium]|nr:lipopolysaccharide heptosyltransferase II [Methylococcaceae bacterium]HIN67810.1 lipopolysaccharide heptosyltransferase II [Methylococcales bacterium]HIA45531.1 lipopolysaccharide heptosyltransferase II [Methylococcaceae bacterium]HIB62884.1 lipopolysaccharide heptosyltransferase II [Methylococcaceae bacterium]HIO12834.1 lipopolysaccharide heptosyltransferase II [Methylococcales bacterium]